MSQRNFQRPVAIDLIGVDLFEFVMPIFLSSLFFKERRSSFLSYAGGWKRDTVPAQAAFRAQ